MILGLIHFRGKFIFKKVSSNSLASEIFNFIFLDFEKATDKEKFGNQNQIPKHDNIIKNFVNIELFHKEDTKQEDCVGWITIMEKAEQELRQILKEERITLVERKKIAEGVINGFRYLDQIGINHYDQKLKNILLLDGIPKIIDFGLINEESGRSGYREMGYTRKGSKFRFAPGLCKFI